MWKGKIKVLQNFDGPVFYNLMGVYNYGQKVKNKKAKYRPCKSNF